MAKLGFAIVLACLVAGHAVASSGELGGGLPGGGRGPQPCATEGLQSVARVVVGRHAQLVHAARPVPRPSLDTSLGSPVPLPLPSAEITYQSRALLGWSQSATIVVGTGRVPWLLPCLSPWACCLGTLEEAQLLSACRAPAWTATPLGRSPRSPANVSAGLWPAD